MPRRIRRLTVRRTKEKFITRSNRPQRIGIGWQLAPVTGWGVYGTNLTLQLVAGGDVAPIPVIPPVPIESFNPFHQPLLAPVFRRHARLQQVRERSGNKTISCPFPVMHALGDGIHPLAGLDNIRGEPDIGVIFFEDSRVSERAAARAQRYRLIVAGSTWNAETLRRNGVAHVTTVLQGVDPTVFHPAPKSGLFRDRFVVFSGGKLEYRKGQDIVLAAFREFQRRHKDALLAFAWQNFFGGENVDAISRRGHVEGAPERDDSGWLDIAPWIERNELPDDTFIDLGHYANGLAGQIVREADVALFPNRCEGGTNLVAMECMACGVPTILSANTGHFDLIRDGNCYPLTEQGAVEPLRPTHGVEGWGESSVGEVVEALERVYADRAEAQKRGGAAAEFMRDWSWDRQVARLMVALAEHIE